jgi:integrase
MSTTEPVKTSIPLEKFVEWHNYPLEAGDYREKYRDLFMLAFYLRGIRPIDLLYARKDQVDDGRLVYYPHKLGGKQKLSVKIEPEAWELIHKYEGKKELLLEFMESREDYNTFLKHWNMGIKAIGYIEKVPVYVKKAGRTYENWKRHHVIPFITPYYARTCWASYSYNHLDLSMDLISQALGHKNGARVTNFYVKREERKVDEANRRLIDFMKDALKNQAPPADAKDAQPPSEL